MIVWKRNAGLRVGTAATLLLTCACGGGSAGPSPGPGPGPGTQVGTLVGAGDIGMCGVSGPEATAGLLDGIPGTVFTAGDNAYFQGTERQFRECYDPSWGRHLARTRPSPGNHEYESPGAQPYFAYFGQNAGPAGLGYYSFNVAEWHIVSLNSNVPMALGSAQQAWLRDDLSANSRPCVAAIWHHPLFSAGPNGPLAAARELWRTLYDANADIIINGHDHLYARFAPQSPEGAQDARRGLREFIVGTGGAELARSSRPQPNLESVALSMGVLRLTLRPSSYEWAFVATTGLTTDSGSDVCH